jgi:superfamily II DNA/RNA helicase
MTNSRYKFNFDFVKTLIFDEADELLNSEFILQIDTIVKSIPETAQICLFSATYSKKILETCSRFMKDPAYVILPDNQVITELVTQWYVQCNSLSEKDGCLVDLIYNNNSETIIVFFNSCSRLEKVSQILSKLDNPINHLCIHSKMESNEKSNSISNFIAGKSKILLASDIASRGLDIHNITLVINYDIPASNDTYVHRIGRSGRGALLGNSVTLIMSDEDKQKMKFIVDIHGIPIKALQTVKIESKSKY